MDAQGRLFPTLGPSEAANDAASTSGKMPYANALLPGPMTAAPIVYSPGFPVATQSAQQVYLSSSTPYQGAPGPRVLPQTTFYNQTVRENGDASVQTRYMYISVSNHAVNGQQNLVGQQNNMTFVERNQVLPQYIFQNTPQLVSGLRPPGPTTMMNEAIQANGTSSVGRTIALQWVNTSGVPQPPQNAVPETPELRQIIPSRDALVAVPVVQSTDFSNRSSLPQIPCTRVYPSIDPRLDKITVQIPGQQCKKTLQSDPRHSIIVPRILARFTGSHGSIPPVDPRGRPSTSTLKVSSTDSPQQAGSTPRQCFGGSSSGNPASLQPYTLSVEVPLTSKADAQPRRLARTKINRRVRVPSPIEPQIPGHDITSDPTVTEGRIAQSDPLPQISNNCMEDSGGGRAVAEAENDDDTESIDSMPEDPRQTRASEPCDPRAPHEASSESDVSPSQDSAEDPRLGNLVKDSHSAEKRSDTRSDSFLKFVDTNEAEAEAQAGSIESSRRSSVSPRKHRRKRFLNFIDSDEDSDSPSTESAREPRNKNLEEGPRDPGTSGVPEEEAQPAFSDSSSEGDPRIKGRREVTERTKTAAPKRRRKRGADTMILAEGTVILNTSRKRRRVERYSSKAYEQNSSRADASFDESDSDSAIKTRPQKTRRRRSVRIRSESSEDDEPLRKQVEPTNPKVPQSVAQSTLPHDDSEPKRAVPSTTSSVSAGLRSDEEDELRDKHERGNARLVCEKAREFVRLFDSNSPLRVRDDQMITLVKILGDIMSQVKPAGEAEQTTAAVEEEQPKKLPDPVVDKADKHNESMEILTTEVSHEQEPEPELETESELALELEVEPEPEPELDTPAEVSKAPEPQKPEESSEVPEKPEIPKPASISQLLESFKSEKIWSPYFEEESPECSVPVIVLRDIHLGPSTTRRLRMNASEIRKREQICDQCTFVSLNTVSLERHVESYHAQKP